jgi:hypothetical protein
MSKHVSEQDEPLISADDIFTLRALSYVINVIILRNRASLP